jgi:hypothetical protein
VEHDIRVHLRDLGIELIEAWRREFTGVASVEISQGDIFSTKAGPISAGDPIDVTADAIISPANSFGFMDGGIDAVYTYQLGPQVQDRLRERLVRDFRGELPVGQVVIVPTGHSLVHQRADHAHSGDRRRHTERIPRVSRGAHGSAWTQPRQPASHPQHLVPRPGDGRWTNASQSLRASDARCLESRARW